MRPFFALPGCRTGTEQFRIAIVVATLAATGCASGPQSATLPPETVTIMSFNVQNLFDTVHDAGKDDFTYLPAAAKDTDAHRARCAVIEVEKWRRQCLDWDWNEAIVDKKMQALAGTVLSVGNGRGPDILVLQEVENLAILERWRETSLAAAGYRPAVLVEGNDARGIDVAFLSRLPLVGAPELHALGFDYVDEDRVRDTRGILEATFALPGGVPLTGFAVHFPAPYHPTTMREQAYAALRELQSALPPDRLAFAAGDFNTTSREDRDASMLDRWARSTWYPAHDDGCGDCRGTYYYAPADDWSFLDMILLSPSMRPDGGAAWRLERGSVTVPTGYAPHVTAAGTPNAFELPDGDGVSDHWPIALRLERAAAP